MCSPEKEGSQKKLLILLLPLDCFAVLLSIDLALCCAADAIAGRAGCTYDGMRFDNLG